MKIVAIDYGTKRIGLAVADGTFALPMRPVESMDAVVEAVEREKPGLLVVGLPLNMDGTEGPAAKAARDFAEEVTALTGVPHEMWDERLTSEAARGKLRDVPLSRKKKRVATNAVAAQLILQSYLDAP